MGDFGIKVTLPGTDVSSTEPRDYVFNSAYTTVKIVSEGSGTLSVPSPGTSFATITHNLGYKPLIIPYFESVPGSGTWTYGAGIYPDNTYSTYIDPTASSVGTGSFVLAIANAALGSTRAVQYHYYLMGDSGE